MDFICFTFINYWGTGCIRSIRRLVKCQFGQCRRPIKYHGMSMARRFHIYSLNWRYLQLKCTYLQLNWRYLQLNWRYLQLNCNSIGIGDISNSIADMCTSIGDIFNSVNKCENGAPYMSAMCDIYPRTNNNDRKILFVWLGPLVGTVTH